jgi:hypothetical protein
MDPFAWRCAMKIRSHTESHIVELEDGSRWQIFPGDLDATLDWTPEVELTLSKVDDDIGSHVLTSETANVRVIAVGESWRVRDAKSILRDG